MPLTHSVVRAAAAMHGTRWGTAGGSNMRTYGTILALSFATVLAAAGCSNTDVTPVDTAPPNPNVTISISPKTGAVQAGNTLAFGATIGSTMNKKVEWAVFSSAPAFGYISQSGLYTAPVSFEGDSLIVYVEATAAANNAKADTARIVVRR
jgi:hypothetical protein